MKSAIKILLLIAGVSVVGHTHAQDNKKSWIPTIGGTLRTKFEYQTDVKNSRFQVRDARIGASGWLTEFVDYKLQINLSDKGKIRTHDLFARLHFFDNQFQFTGGQFRVPISVDAAATNSSGAIIGSKFMQLLKSEPTIDRAVDKLQAALQE